MNTQKVINLYHTLKTLLKINSDSNNGNFLWGRRKGLTEVQQNLNHLKTVDMKMVTVMNCHYKRVQYWKRLSNIKGIKTIWNFIVPSLLSLSSHNKPSLANTILLPNSPTLSPSTYIIRRTPIASLHKITRGNMCWRCQCLTITWERAINDNYEENLPSLHFFPKSGHTYTLWWGDCF